ncbi:helix-turn-helix transcriptional regulator [Oricola indica]|uniref:helix-turn-helix transcriptional regulator n=1 Tax=Oricola indica TaxID=2872591 RepID=UPI003CCC1DDE
MKTLLSSTAGTESQQYWQNERSCVTKPDHERETKVVNQTSGHTPRITGPPVDSPATNGAFAVTSFCEWAGISRSTLYREIAAGRIQTRKAGSRTLILRAEAEAWLNSLPEAA